MVIPESNPVAEHCGKAQKMTLENGQPKGMQHVLEECGSMSLMLNESHSIYVDNTSVLGYAIVNTTICITVDT